ncbi:FHA domain-containing protein [Actinomadura madurae]|uniref:FHA domain-containing protein n=1 Tax=Actinomadura madurae TaxID=1993 RepID=UPI00202751AB|nr:FHA domain-containing protein [Actinomadura madurae]URM99933.1 FHA domain-containing protein [Actinomadura madurae]
MASCPNGHTSQSPDYCDICGERIGAASSGGPSSGEAAGPQSSPGARPCPDCGTPGTDRFCEACGYDFATGGGKPTPTPPVPAPPVPAPPVPAPPVPAPPVPAPPVPAPPVPAPPVPAPPVPGGVWTAVVTADRDYYNAIMAEEGPDSASLAFPPYAPERRIPLTGRQVRIGRRSSSQPTPPEIDLREPPEDPGVSHVHAVLLARPDGAWTLVDPGSTNRTCVNGSTDPIPFNVEIPLSEGDRIHVGAWTTITLTRGEAT